MKIAFVGKGGSGKTTLAALVARRLASTGAPLLAIDADINQHLATALGATEDEAVMLPALATTYRPSRTTCGATTRKSGRPRQW